ncbi:S-layer homology domain-containing protein [Parageobacillus sp. VR-IP]|uniref:S-layer homology domain-containing protein n=1 Tax=Parageobacillus sp. VR-IP TaxID=2742205 RepID=UPI00158186EB|nr:S-layer homology domain-containing protein [Parageobacillus sp. VR-IP]NUK29810.1 S-layer homology domain-containing protein [Parageobacillus sp. VR-IP]
MRLLASLFLVFSLLFTNISVSFADDITGIALEEEMRAMVNQGIVEGYPDGHYRPNDPVTRGQFATFVARALQLREGSGHFSDVSPSSKLADGIYKASAAGIVQGYSNGTFGVYNKITREEMAVMIDRALDYLGIEKKQALLDHFTDVNGLYSTSKIAISHNVYYGIIRGIPNTDGKTFRFDPKAYATRAHAAAFLYRLLEVWAEQAPEMAYQVAAIQNGQLTPLPKRYATFAQAEAAVTNWASQVIMQGTKIVKMASGNVIAQPSPGKSTTIIYESTLSKSLTYVAPNTEMKYLGADEEKVKVQIANTIGYVKQSEVMLVPTALLQGRSYYMAKKGELYHYIYKTTSNKYAVPYLYGKAPSFMQDGQKYYSWDGETFYNEAGKLVGTAYQYFNVLPIRTKTNYTAEELNKFAAANRSDSPLKTLGEAFKKAEKTYNVNALYLLAHAILESDGGTSQIAKEKKNLFGIQAVDSDPLNSAMTFNSFEDCINYMAQTMISNGYANPKSWKYNGAVLGDKTIGFNVFYASDPYWGQKIAGLMYQADKFLGWKDWGKYTIMGTTTEGVKVRREPNTNESPLYTYKLNNTPVIKLGETAKQPDGYVWYKIHTDLPTGEDAYIRSDLLEPLLIAK